MTPLNDIVFERQVGGLKREAESEDVISGLIMLLGAMPFASGSPFIEIGVTPQIKMLVAKYVILRSLQKFMVLKNLKSHTLMAF